MASPGTVPVDFAAPGAVANRERADCLSSAGVVNDVATCVPHAAASVPVGRHRVMSIALAVVGILLFAWQLFRLAEKPRGDFPLHWEMGRRLVAGEFIYEFGWDVPYLPFWGLAHAPLTAAPVHTAQLLLCPLFVVALLALVAALERLTRDSFPLPRDASTWTAVLAVACCAGVLHRDIFECGVNLALVALSWLAILAWSRHRDWLAGGLLGLAIALKCTPAALLVYFLFKRQWKMTLATSLAAILLTLSPSLWMGRTEYRRALGTWWQHASRALTSPDPTIGVLGDEPPQNMALRPALARYLMRVSPTHQAHLNDPLDVPFLNLPPTTAGRIIKLVMLTLAIGVAWRYRAPILRRDDPAIVWQCATIAIAQLLYSPITWLQHCVAALPALYLIVRSAQVGRSWHWPGMGGVTAFVVATIVLKGDVLGSRCSLLIHSYHLRTFCLLLLLVITVMHGPTLDGPNLNATAPRRC